jgi:hypothetical protein
MALTNISKPSTSLTNTAKVTSYETWDSITTTWASETRTWDDMGSLMDNISLDTDPLWSSRSFPWLMVGPWQQIGGMTNIAKPA